MASRTLPSDFICLQKVVSSRRTEKIFDGARIEREVLEELLNLAVLAPNHGLTQAWRFRALGALSISQWISQLKKSDQERSIQKTLERLEKVGAVIYVTVIRDERPRVHEENFAATSAAVQNILLGASALGLGSFWSSGAAMTCEPTRSFLKVSESEVFVAAVWLGHLTTPSPSKPRLPLDRVVTWLE